MTTIRVQTPFLRMTGLGVPAAPPSTRLTRTTWRGRASTCAGRSRPAGRTGQRCARRPRPVYAVPRPPARPAVAEALLDLSPTARGLQADATLPVSGGARFEFDPEVLAATLARVPAAFDDLDLLLDAYPQYVTLRFGRPVRYVSLTVAARPLPGPRTRLAVVRAHDGDDCVGEDSLVGDGGPATTGSRSPPTASPICAFISTAGGSPSCCLDRAAHDGAGGLGADRGPPRRPPRAVRDRVPATFRAAYEPGWTTSVPSWDRLFDPADDRPRWAREFTDIGTPVVGDPAGGEVAPTWSYDLQAQILLFTVDPFLARLVGLLYVDTSAEAAGGDLFDYLVVATFQVPDPPVVVGEPEFDPDIDLPPGSFDPDLVLPARFDPGRFHSGPVDTGPWLPGGGRSSIRCRRSGRRLDHLRAVHRQPPAARAAGADPGGGDPAADVPARPRHRDAHGAGPRRARLDAAAGGRRRAAGYRRGPLPRRGPARRRGGLDAADRRRPGRRRRVRRRAGQPDLPGALLDRPSWRGHACLPGQRRRRVRPPQPLVRGDRADHPRHGRPAAAGEHLDEVPGQR